MQRVGNTRALSFIMQLVMHTGKAHKTMASDAKREKAPSQHPDKETLEGEVKKSSLAFMRIVLIPLA